MNFRNKIEDLLSIGTPLFQPSDKRFEYYDVSKYKLIGHYRRVEEVIIKANPDQINCKNISWMRLFNFLVWSKIHGTTTPKAEFFIKSLLHTFQDDTETRNHLYSDGALYLKNDYHHLSMRPGWIGALPQLRLLSFLMILDDRSFDDLIEAVIKSIYAPVAKTPTTIHNEFGSFINAITSKIDSNIFVFEYPENKSPNLVVNCMLYFAALNSDLISSGMIDDNDFTENTLNYLDLNECLLNYSVESKNPISPAYFDLHRSIIISMEKIDYCNFQNIFNTRNFIQKNILLLKKISYRTRRGYR